LIRTSLVVGLLLLQPTTSPAGVPLARPTFSEIRAIEAKVRLPRGASALSDYVRYYYSSESAGSRIVEGVYIAKFWLKPADIPAGDVSVIGGQSEISIPSDAECTVLIVRAGPATTDRVTASCTSGLIQLLQKKK
jgi:hypothetical protein